LTTATTVAIIADTHMPKGKRRLPDACVRRIVRADLLIHLGDFSTVAAYEEIAVLGPELVAVHGNVDEPALRRRLPERQEVKIGSVTLGLIHDAGARKGRLARMRRAFPGADAVLFGHSHLPLHERAPGFQIFNPGSPTERRRAPGHTMGIATVRDGSVRLRLVEL
jgi:putative phosphoesterase